MHVEISRPTEQAELTAVARVLDDAFGLTPPATMLRVGFMHDLVRADQLVLLAGTVEQPLGAIVALRARDHIEMPDMAVAPEHQGKGIGAVLFQALTEWAESEGFSEIQWSVSPSNYGGVNAYLSYGARIVGWLDNAYGVASDAFYTGTTDRFRGAWRAGGWQQTAEEVIVHRDDHSKLRELLLRGDQITERRGDQYCVARMS